MNTPAEETPRTLAAWLRLLEARHPVEIELGLERIGAVAARLAIGRIARKTVVVAGTNGKGSCVRTLEALALRAGLRVGCYTSPHLVRYNERVRLEGQEAEDAQFCRAFETIDAHRGDTPLTYFEMGTLAALLMLSAEKLDLAILEVGLGGRYDAVNIVDADVAVITSIALDHEHWLGGDRETIAREKAGIARPGRPAICLDPDPPASLMACLGQIGARVSCLGRDFHYAVEGENLSIRLDAGAEGGYTELPIPALPLPSVVGAVACFHRLGYFSAPGDLTAVFASLSLPGRYQKLSYRGRTLVLDVAHNPAAAGYLAERLKREDRPAFGVVALMADKDVEGFVTALGGVFERWFVGDLMDVKRALPGAALAAVLRERRLAVTAAATIEAALDRALAEAGEKNLLVVCGSFFTISAVVTHLGIDNGV